MPVWTYPKNEEKPKFAQLIIPTLDSVRFEKLLHLSYSVEKASLLVGGPGTAKTSCINQFISRFNPETTTSKTITFSSLTSPQIFQITMESAVEKRQGRTYGPPGGKQVRDRRHTLHVFVMPGTQETLTAKPPTRDYPPEHVPFACLSCLQIVAVCHRYLRNIMACKEPSESLTGDLFLFLADNLNTLPIVEPLLIVGLSSTATASFSSHCPLCLPRADVRIH